MSPHASSGFPNYQHSVLHWAVMIQNVVITPVCHTATRSSSPPFILSTCKTDSLLCASSTILFFVPCPVSSSCSLRPTLLMAPIFRAVSASHSSCFLSRSHILAVSHHLGVVTRPVTNIMSPVHSVIKMLASLCLVFALLWSPIMSVGGDDFLDDLFPWDIYGGDSESISMSQMSPARRDDGPEAAAGGSGGSSSHEPWVPAPLVAPPLMGPGYASPAPAAVAAAPQPILPEAARKRLRSKTPRPAGFEAARLSPPPARGLANRLSLPPAVAAAGGLGVGALVVAAVPAGAPAGGGDPSVATPSRPPAAPAAPTPGVGIWTGYENMVFEQHRQKYWWVYKKLKRWLEVRVQALTDVEISQPRGKELVSCHNNWKSVSLTVKSSVVQEFLAATHAPQDLRQWAALTWAPSNESEPSADSGFAIRGMLVLLTYQGAWGLFDEASLPAAEVVDEADRVDDPYVELVSRLRRFAALDQLWKDFLRFVQVLKKRFSCEHHAASCELCTQTWSESRQVRIHFHMCLKHNKVMASRARDLVMWRDTRPHLSHHCQTLQQRAGHGWAGMYYVAAPKFGAVFSETSRAAFSEFPVNPDWVMTLISSDKMSIRVGREQLIRCGKGLQRRLGDLDRLAQARREIALEARVREVQRHLAASARRFHQFPAIQHWLATASAPFQMRKKFLVLEGPSGVGKTEFIRALFGATRTLELNCASCGTSPDLRQLDPERHRLVLFDEASPEMVLKNRKLFQAPAALVDLGHSPTGMNVYRVWLNDAVLVVNSNRWSSDCLKQSNEDRAWLVANQVLVIVTAAMWDTSPPEEAAPSQ